MLARRYNRPPMDFLDDSRERLSLNAKIAFIGFQKERADRKAENDKLRAQAKLQEMENRSKK